MKTSLPPRSRLGFSLVEVVVAIGIAASTITLMIGLIPAGLSNFRDALNTTVTSQIGQRLLYEAAQTDYQVLTAAPATKPWRYFDDEGTELTSEAGAIYHALTRVQNTTSIPTEAGGTPQPHLATVIVQVALNPENQELPVAGPSTGPTDPPEGTLDSSMTSLKFSTFTGHVAKSL